MELPAINNKKHPFPNGCSSGAGVSFILAYLA
jgi:hypothetical protein